VLHGSTLRAVTRTGLFRNAAVYAPRGEYTLPGVGTLREEGGWHGATAKADGASWRFTARGIFRKNVTATDVAGQVVGEYREPERTVRWSGREVDLLRGWGGKPSHYRKRPFLSRDGRYALAERGRIFAFLRGNGEPLNPVSLELDDTAELEAGFLLFVAFLTGWLAQRDRSNDGL
jgi:hypothetical protein